MEYKWPSLRALARTQNCPLCRLVYFTVSVSNIYETKAELPDEIVLTAPHLISSVSGLPELIVSIGHVNKMLRFGKIIVHPEIISVEKYLNRELLPDEALAPDTAPQIPFRRSPSTQNVVSAYKLPVFTNALSTESTFSFLNNAQRYRKRWSRLMENNDVQIKAETARSRAQFLQHNRQDLRFVDIPKIKGWLKTCEETHFDLKTLPQMNPRKLKKLRFFLIDVENMMLVEKALLTRYLALSYVWGGVEMGKTIKSNLSTLSTKGGLLLSSAKLPKTILDAIHLVKQLGEKYLWVDSICIIQDDSDHKHRQIQMMHMIYQGAVMTIISFGKNANTPLPGIRQQRTPASSTEIIPTSQGNLRLEGVGGDYLSATLSSVYNRRGWTFQERLLSRRCLYITNHEVFFQCDQGQRNEITLEDLSNSHPFYKEVGRLYIPTLITSTLRPKFTSFTGDNFQEMYERFVKEYTSRELSYPADALDAFSGVASALTQVFRGSKLHSGLSEKFIDGALLWKAKPRGNRLEIRNPETLPGFPSWSWASENKPVYFLNNYTEKDKEKKTRVDFGAEFEFILYETRDLVLFFNGKIKQLKRAKSVRCRNWSVKLPRPTIPCRPSLTSLPKELNILCFWAEATKAERFQEAFNLDFQGDISSYECILLSRFVSSLGDTEYPAEEIDVFGNVWGILNIMLIHWKGEIARRMDVCQTREDLWLAGAPQLKHIRLA